MPKTMGPSYVTQMGRPPLPRCLRGWRSQSRGNNIGVLGLTLKRVRAGERGQRSTYRVGLRRGLRAAQWRDWEGRGEDHPHPTNPRLSLTLKT